MAVGT
jgi:formate hydrogenlyase subunit 3/multisubunit Na+/H+ antiporter MnhD subunit